MSDKVESDNPYRFLKLLFFFFCIKMRIFIKIKNKIKYKVV